MSGPGGTYNPNDNDEGNAVIPVPQCRDGADNDGDGLIDHPADPGCSNPDDNNETNNAPVPQCRDGADNDGDGDIDYPGDPGCSNADDDDETDTCAPNTGQSCQGPFNNNCSPPIAYGGTIQCNGLCGATTAPGDDECGLPSLDCGSGVGGVGCLQVFNKGDTCQITFTVDNADRCVIAPVGSGPGGTTFNNLTTPPPETHSWTSPPLNATTLYSITCFNGPVVRITKTFTCKLNPRFEPF
jgi:hypothetical protein